ncbi:YqiJ family protein [Vogesella mureinivorans]|uniref:YqiJ family protein n=1 Tax=Vogesella mureinivorans TaxID=657276 RepID=UPI0011C8341D|nr:YqiJ family protein [Vogesella mureinivorans]
MSWFTATATWPFWVALLLILGIALLEGIGLLLAVSPSNAVDAWLPDFDDAEWLGRLLGWLHLGRLPSLILLLLFLTGFALFGFALQHLLLALTGHALPAVLAGVLAIPAGITTTRSLGGMLARILPRDESSAVSEHSFVGRSAIISAGHARRGLAAQARVKDQHGRTHFLMVEPDLEDELLNEGSEVLLVSKPGSFYRAIHHPYPNQPSDTTQH